MGLLGHLVLVTFLAAAINLGVSFVENWKAASASGTYVVDDFEITVCYLGPPVGFYPRFFVFVGLLLAVVGVFRRTFPRSIMATVGIAGALVAYVCWWLDSYRVFRNFTDFDIKFLNNPEIKQVSYLYNGTLLDVCVAASLVVCFVLLIDRLLSRKRRGLIPD